jgi:hypothetical protein
VKPVSLTQACFLEKTAGLASVQERHFYVDNACCCVFRHADRRPLLHGDTGWL